MACGKIAIVGSGAVGLYYGGMLAASGCDVHFLLRSDYEWVKRRGVCLLLPGRELTVHPVPAHRTPESIGPVDLVIVALKTTANDALPDLLGPLLQEGTAVLTLQNGLGNEAFLARHVGAGRVMGGLCFICLNRVGPGTVRNYFPGNLTLGEYRGGPGERIAALVAAFREAGIDCRVAADLNETRWRKLVWNVPFNGLTIAAGGIDTERLLASPGMTGEIAALMHEVRAIAGAAGVVIEEEFLRRQIEITRPMGPYRPSSLIDFMDKRPVEIESIWEAPLREAERLGVSAPRLRLLHAVLRALC